MTAQQETAAARRARRPVPAVMERTVDEPFLPELRKRAEALAARLR
jgi:hypothetical protein